MTIYTPYMTTYIYTVYDHIYIYTVHDRIFNDFPAKHYVNEAYIIYTVLASLNYRPIL
jgi:hypothetical protein